MSVVLLALWLFVAGYAGALRTASAGTRAQWTTFLILAVSLTLGQDRLYVDRLTGLPNLTLVVIHLGGVLAAAAQLEFIATATSIRGAGPPPASPVRYRRAFTAVVCILIVLAGAFGTGNPEAVSTAAAYGGTVEAASARVLMCVHLDVAAYLTGMLCLRARSAAADALMRRCLLLMAIASFLAVAYAEIEAAVTVALWRRISLGGFITAHMLGIDQALICLACSVYALGCAIPLVHTHILDHRHRRAAAKIEGLWAILVGRSSPRSIARTLSGGQARTYLVRLVLELSDERRRLITAFPPGTLERTRALLLDAGLPSREDAAVVAAVLRAALALCDARPGQFEAGDLPCTLAAVPGADSADALEAARWWAAVARAWDDPRVAVWAQTIALLGSVEPAR